MKILQVIDSASILFSQKIKVILVHAETKELISTHILDKRQLPPEFNKPTILEIENIRWRVVKANVDSPGNYFRSPKISLHVILSDHPLPVNKFLVPTHALFNQFTTTNTISLFKDFSLALADEEWLQFEFHPVESIDFIQETTSIISTIINSPDENGNLLGYTSSYIRDSTWARPLQIQLDEFCSFMNIKEKGNIIMPNNNFIENGFSLRSDNYIYYGITNNGAIKKLAITGFDCIDDELSAILSRFNLVFVDWCNASILS
ncbi:hypothetical protein [Chitinophaga filiformis]|uniref:Uncharacterized protein n=1 Tax=Chitinophaga filiformis TaxID=104663 RepID=A0A1G7UN63_CHIFI|nr:hypothetical protein [Chitinophaga filiformis]SDG48788.1 hypothetical protein SAMN04488121_104439 [Chitinophaga filiformis]